MIRFRFLSFLTVGILIPFISKSQHHYNTWFRTTLNVPVSKRIKIDSEFQHRRQNGTNNSNPFDKNLMVAFRSWAHYQHNEDIRFSISPFAYFSNYRIIQNTEDEIRNPLSEIRLSVAVDLQHEIFKHFHVFDRTALEYRIFNNQQKDITRLRARFGIKYDITSKMNISVFDELLVNLTGVQKQHFLDHDRIGISVEYKLLSNLKIDAGYIYIMRLPVSSMTKIKESNFFLNLTYQFKENTSTHHHRNYHS